ncbi:hypothetical protein J6590_063772, partial [Homalodisca vitripennis]
MEVKILMAQHDVQVSLMGAWSKLPQVSKNEPKWRAGVCEQTPTRSSLERLTDILRKPYLAHLIRHYGAVFYSRHYGIVIYSRHYGIVFYSGHYGIVIYIGVVVCWCVVDTT